MLYYNRIDLSEGLILLKVIKFRHYYFFFHYGYKFQDLSVMIIMIMFCLNLSDIAIIAVKNVDCHCIIHNIRKYDAIHLLKNYVLDDREYI